MFRSAAEDGEEVPEVQEVWQGALLLYDVGVPFLVPYAEIWDVEAQEGVQDELAEEQDERVQSALEVEVVEEEGVSEE